MDIQKYLNLKTAKVKAEADVERYNKSYPKPRPREADKIMAQKFWLWL